MVLLHHAVTYKIIPSGLTASEIEYLYGQSGLSGIITDEYAAYVSAYENWVDYYTRSDNTVTIAEAQSLADSVRSTYTTLEQEIGRIFALKQADYRVHEPEIAHGYYTQATADAFNATTVKAAVAVSTPTLSQMIDVAVNYDTEIEKLAPAPHPDFMLNEGNNLTEIIDIAKTEWMNAANAYKDAFDRWNANRTAENAEAANLLWDALVDGINGDLETAVIAAQSIIADDDEYCKGFRDGLSGKIANNPEGTRLEKIAKTASLNADLVNSGVNTYSARWAALTSISGYDEYLKDFGYTWENDNDKAAIRAIVDDATPEYLNHPDVMYGYGLGEISTFIGAQNVVLNGTILQDLSVDYYIVVVYESERAQGTRENLSYWAYNYNARKWYVKSGNSSNFTFTLTDEFTYTITIGIFNKKTYITGETAFSLSADEWTQLS
jgi:hypothetical protein